MCRLIVEHFYSGILILSTLTWVKLETESKNKHKPLKHPNPQNKSAFSSKSNNRSCFFRRTLPLPGQISLKITLKVSNQDTAWLLFCGKCFFLFLSTEASTARPFPCAPVLVRVCFVTCGFLLLPWRCRGYPTAIINIFARFSLKK